MTKPEFVYLFLDNIYLALVILILYFTIGFFLYRKQIYSIYDPGLLFLILAISAHSVIIFLYILNKLNFITVIYFFLTQIAFTIGWFLFKPIKFKNKPRNTFLFGKYSKLFYYISLSIFIICQIILYLYKGIPLLSQYRLELAKSGDGFGLFYRLVFVSSIFSYVIAIFKLLYLNQSWLNIKLDKIVIYFYVITQVLNGSKAGILLSILFVFLPIFFSQQFAFERNNERRLKRKLLMFLILSIPFGVLTVLIQNSLFSDDRTSFITGLTTIFIRFLNSGDIFYMAWVNDVVYNIPSYWTDGFLAIFSDFLGMFRIVSRSELPTHLGLQVMWLLNNTDTFDGPNLRHNVFGIFYFGIYGAIFYSFTLGIMFGFIRNKLLFLLPKSIAGLSIFSALFYIACYIPQDFSSITMSYFLSFIIVLLIILLLSSILSKLT